MANERKLKIQPRFFPRSFRQYVVLPELRLAGRWLEDFGFSCGGYAIISCDWEEITIKFIKAQRVPSQAEEERSISDVKTLRKTKKMAVKDVFTLWHDADRVAEPKPVVKTKKAAPRGTAKRNASK